MLYKPNKLQLEDKSLGFSKNDVSSYAKKDILNIYIIIIYLIFLDY